MSDLIKALNIFLKYADLHCPTHCEHDVLHVYGVDWNDIVREDQDTLVKLGFFYCEEDDTIQSFRFGSA